MLICLLHTDAIIPYYADLKKTNISKFWNVCGSAFVGQVDSAP
jgi:hypothetical protein